MGDAHDERQRADALRQARLQSLLVAQRDRLPIAASLALQVSLETGRLMERRRASWRSIGVGAGTLARCLNAENVKLSSVEAVAASLGCDALIAFVPRWPCSAGGSTPLSAQSAQAHPAATPTGATENDE